MMEKPTAVTEEEGEEEEEEGRRRIKGKRQYLLVI